MCLRCSCIVTAYSTLAAKPVVVDILAGTTHISSSIEQDNYFAYSCQMSLSGVSKPFLCHDSQHVFIFSLILNSTVNDQVCRLVDAIS